jgi:serine/threonine-protein kinase HipA
MNDDRNRCLYCYLPLTGGETDFHAKCCRKFFGTPTPPLFDHTSDEMQQLAEEIVQRSVAVTGVQPKLSLTLEANPKDPKNRRLTIVGLWGNYILKPPTLQFPNLPENEDLTMHLAQLFKIKTAEHSLIRLKSGELAYITKRFDREDGNKLAMEDMCQLTETLTEDKYRSSMERVGKKIREYSSVPGLDTINFFELVLFSFITGNADMHLKNFSMLTSGAGTTQLAPAYDLLCTRLALPEDKEESALTINARKNKIRLGDFRKLGEHLKIPERSIANSFTKMESWKTKADPFIHQSFLPETLKISYAGLITENLEKLK